MSRSPARRPEAVLKFSAANPAPSPSKRLRDIGDYRVAIDAICEASHPKWVDINQRRRWLESHAEQQPTSDRKLQAVKSAAATIGFRFE